MKRAWPLVKRVDNVYLWSVPGSGGTRYERDDRLEALLLRREPMQTYERPEVLATYDEAELIEDAAICVCYTCVGTP